MQLWELKSHWVPVDLEKDTGSFSGNPNTQSVHFTPTWKEDFNKAWAEAELLAKDGWELVGVAPETCARISVGERDGVHLTMSASWTAGYLLAFRRPKEANASAILSG